MPGSDRTPEILSRLDDHDSMQMKILAMLEDIGRKVDVAAKAQKVVEAALAGLQSTVASHEHLLKMLTEHQTDHGRLLTDHSRALTDLAQSLVAARDTAREALKSGSDIKVENEQFQKAVQTYLSQATKSLSDDVTKLDKELKAELSKVVEQNTAQDKVQSATQLKVGEIETKVDQILDIATTTAKSLGHPLLRKVLIVVALLGTFAGAFYASYLGARQASSGPPPSSVLPTATPKR